MPNSRYFNDFLQKQKNKPPRITNYLLAAPQKQLPHIDNALKRKFGKKLCEYTDKGRSIPRERTHRGVFDPHFKEVRCA